MKETNEHRNAQRSLGTDGVSSPGSARAAQSDDETCREIHPGNQEIPLVITALQEWCPRGDSNARTRLRRPMLYPLSYEGRERRP